MWPLAVKGGLIIRTIFQPDSGGLRCSPYEILAASRRINGSVLQPLPLAAFAAALLSIGLVWLLVRLGKPPRGGERCGDRIVVLTFAHPKGGWAELVEADETPLVMYWHQKDGRFLVLHESGKMTFVDAAEWRRLIAAKEGRQGPP